MTKYKLYYERKSLTSYLVNATKRYLRNIGQDEILITLAKKELKNKLNNDDIPTLANLCRYMANEINEKIVIWHSGNVDWKGNIKE